MKEILCLNEYQELATAFASPHGSIIMAALGLCGESGEFAELVKKAAFHNREDLLNDEGLNELGDILWYLAYACHKFGTTLQEVASLNIAKLRHRYPQGFVQGGGIREAAEPDGS